MIRLAIIISVVLAGCASAGGQARNSATEPSKPASCEEQFTSQCKGSTGPIKTGTAIKGTVQIKAPSTKAAVPIGKESDQRLR